MMGHARLECTIKPICNRCGHIHHYSQCRVKKGKPSYHPDKPTREAKRKADLDAQNEADEAEIQRQQRQNDVVRESNALVTEQLRLRKELRQDFRPAPPSSSFPPFPPRCPQPPPDSSIPKMDAEIKPPSLFPSAEQPFVHPAALIPTSGDMRASKYADSSSNAFKNYQKGIQGLKMPADRLLFKPASSSNGPLISGNTQSQPPQPL
jgi:hypothetical protein